jgi:hypothetical protein
MTCPGLNAETVVLFNVETVALNGNVRLGFSSSYRVSLMLTRYDGSSYSRGIYQSMYPMVELAQLWSALIMIQFRDSYNM